MTNAPHVGAPPRWHTEPFDPVDDTAPVGGPDDCTGEEGQTDG